MDKYILEGNKVVDTKTKKIFSSLEELVFELNNQHRNIEKLKKSIYIDDLTKAYTRAHLETIKEKYKKKQCYVTFIDSNNLKQINDFRGHRAGDNYLKKIACILQSFGIVVRYGGDEFIVLSEKEPKDLYSTREFSAGSVFKEFGMDLEQAISLADEKMFEQKRSSKKLLDRGI